MDIYIFGELIHVWHGATPTIKVNITSLAGVLKIFNFIAFIATTLSLEVIEDILLSSKALCCSVLYHCTAQVILCD